MEQEKGAVYCRLSQDDGSAGESGSIQTQRTLLTQYCKEHSIQIVDIRNSREQPITRLKSVLIL